MTRRPLRDLVGRLACISGVRLVAISAVLAIALAGCGGGSHQGSSGTKESSSPSSAAAHAGPPSGLAAGCGPKEVAGLFTGLANAVAQRRRGRRDRPPLAWQGLRDHDDLPRSARRPGSRRFTHPRGGLREPGRHLRRHRKAGSPRQRGRSGRAAAQHPQGPQPRRSGGWRRIRDSTRSPCARGQGWDRLCHRHDLPRGDDREAAAFGGADVRRDPADGGGSAGGLRLPRIRRRCRRSHERPVGQRLGRLRDRAGSPSLHLLPRGLRPRRLRGSGTPCSRRSPPSPGSPRTPRGRGLGRRQNGAPPWPRISAAAMPNTTGCAWPTSP